MENKEPQSMIVTLKNGHQFSHGPAPNESKDDFWKFVNSIISEFSKIRSGILTAYYPFGIYRLDDISCIHFAEEAPPIGTLPMGFRPYG